MGLSFRFYNSHFDDLYQAGGNVSKDGDTVYLITDFTKVLLILYKYKNKKKYVEEDIYLII